MLFCENKSKDIENIQTELDGESEVDVEGLDLNEAHDQFISTIESRKNLVEIIMANLVFLRL